MSAVNHPMRMLAVESSNIAGIGYDCDARELFVHFKSGATWRYFDVSAEVFARLVTAESIGKFFGSHIKPICKAEKVEHDDVR